MNIKKFISAFIGLLCGVQGLVVSPPTRTWRRQSSRSISFGTSSTGSTSIGASSVDTGRGIRSSRNCWDRRRLRVEYTRSLYVRMSVKDMLGADVESNGLFDPLGLSRDEPSLFRRRAVELKHGRVSMVAMVGILVQSLVQFPGFPPFRVDSAVRPLAVMRGLWASEMMAVLVALFAIGVIELTVGRQDYIDRAPGELGEFGAFAKPVDEEEWENIQLAEIKHGRLAMLAVVGALVQEVVTGEGPVEQLLTGNINPFA